MLKENSETGNVTPHPAPEDSSKQGCATSFLTQKGGEMDKVCGPTQLHPAKKPKEPYVQPDDEKESGGEA
jgi:hypothetical protein